MKQSVVLQPQAMLLAQSQHQGPSHAVDRNQGRSITPQPHQEYGWSHWVPLHVTMLGGCARARGNVESICQRELRQVDTHTWCWPSPEKGHAAKGIQNQTAAPPAPEQLVVLHPETPESVCRAGGASSHLHHGLRAAEDAVLSTSVHPCGTHPTGCALVALTVTCLCLFQA